MPVKEIVIMSGKGGTGKTSITAAFSRLLKNRAVFVDADVDAADLAILMNAKLIKENVFPGGYVPVIDYNKCTRCGKCYELCRFGAISPEIEVSYLKCEGCKVCGNFCPEGAIDMVVEESGNWFVSESPYGPLVHARLHPGGENSGKLVATVRQAAKKLAEEMKVDYILTDGPPGVGCPAISSITGADLLVFITEPSVSGVHDTKRAIELANHFSIPSMVIVNKYDLNLAATSELESFLEKPGIPVIGKIHYDTAFYDALVKRKSIMDVVVASSRTVDVIKKSWSKIIEKINKGGKA